MFSRAINPISLEYLRIYDVVHSELVSIWINFFVYFWDNISGLYFHVSSGCHCHCCHTAVIVDCHLSSVKDLEIIPMKTEEDEQFFLIIRA